MAAWKGGPESNWLQVRLVYRMDVAIPDDAIIDRYQEFRRSGA